MKWSKRHATGVTRLDEQHKLLFQMVEDYQQALAEGRGERLYSLFLNFLVHYCRDHFAREERLMEAYRCPVAQVNKMGHVQFVEVVTGYQRRYTGNGFSAADAWVPYRLGRALAGRPHRADRRSAEGLCGGRMSV